MTSRNKYRRVGASAVLTIAVATVNGCVTYPQREDFGDAVRHTQSVQSATADTHAAPQDGERGRAMLKVYREDVAIPKEIKSDITITIGSGEKK